MYQELKLTNNLPYLIIKLNRTERMNTAHQITVFQTFVNHISIISILIGLHISGFNIFVLDKQKCETFQNVEHKPINCSGFYKIDP